MKSVYQFVLFVILLVFFFCSCKKDVKQEEIVAVETIDSIKLQVQKVTTPVAPKNPGNYSVWFAMTGSKIYYANPSNTGQAQFMLEYNLQSNTFSERKVDDNVCACGYMSNIVSDGQNLFYVANDATKYTASSDTWSAVSYPPTAKDNNGEAGVIYYNNRIYFLGGRTPTTKFKYYDIGSNSWYNVADYLYSTSTSQMAVADNKIYALGGEGAGTKFSSFTEGGNWEALPDLPFEMPADYSTKLVASFQDRYILALVADKIYIYDAINNKWKTTPAPVTINDSYLNIFSDNINVYIAGKTASNDFSLYKLTLSSLPS